MYFLGYMDGELGYHLWDPVKHKVIRSKGVIFNELKMFKRSTCDTEVKKIINRLTK